MSCPITRVRYGGLTGALSFVGRTGQTNHTLPDEGGGNERAARGRRMKREQFGGVQLGTKDRQAVNDIRVWLKTFI